MDDIYNVLDFCSVG